MLKNTFTSHYFILPNSQRTLFAWCRPANSACHLLRWCAINALNVLKIHTRRIKITQVSDSRQRRAKYGNLIVYSNISLNTNTQFSSNTIHLGTRVARCTSCHTSPLYDRSFYINSANSFWYAYAKTRKCVIVREFTRVCITYSDAFTSLELNIRSHASIYMQKCVQIMLYTNQH